VKWQSIEKPKEVGGWDLRNFHHFGKALVVKCFGGLLYNKGLWSWVISRKYVDPDSLVDWIRNPTKLDQNTSIIWKAMV
jgi:hypothetical protein